MTAPEIPEGKKDSEQIKTLALYGAFIVALPLQIVPVMAVQILSIALLVGALIAIKIVRGGNPDDSLISNHAVYLSRSFWVWSALMTIGGAVGGYILYTQNDLDSLLALARDLSKNQEKGAAFQTMSTYAMFSFGPGIAYLAYRLIKGLHRALYGYRLAKPKSFF